MQRDHRSPALTNPGAPGWAVDATSAMWNALARDGEPSVSLSQLQAASVDIQWFEAVSIVRALCIGLIDSGDQRNAAGLDVASVFIGPAGQVRTAAVGKHTAPSEVYAVGAILSEILPETGRPIGLGAVLINAMSSPSFYRSLADLAEALAYFERPNRVALIQAVYRRWRNASPASDFVQTPEPAPVNPPVQESSPREPAQRPRAVRRLYWAAIASVVLAVVTTAIALLVRANAPVVTENLPALRSVATVPTAAFNAATLAVGRLLGAGRSPTHEPPEVAGKPAAPSVPSAPARVRRQAPSEVRPEPATTVAAAKPRAASARTEPPRVAESAPVRITPVQRVSEDPRTYSAADPEVSPPAPVPPQRLGPIPPGVSANDSVIIEVWVNERGTVDAVKAASSPRTIGESLLVTVGLSAAKSWRFQPALKDGNPVRYRAIVPIPHAESFLSPQ